MTNVIDTKKPSELLDKLIQFSLNPVILDPILIRINHYIETKNI